MKAELEAAEGKIVDLDGRLDELKAAHEASKNDASELRELDEKVAQADAALKSVLDGASKLKAELKKWQDALENVGVKSCEDKSLSSRKSASVSRWPLRR